MKKYTSNVKSEEIKRFLHEIGFNFKDDNFEHDIENSAVEISNIDINRDSNEQDIKLLLNHPLTNLFSILFNFEFNEKTKSKIFLFDYNGHFLTNNFDLEADKKISTYLNEHWIKFLYNKFGEEYRKDYNEYWQKLKGKNLEDPISDDKEQSM